jgi:L-ribulose-5-phosphate 4-epimerase
MSEFQQIRDDCCEANRALGASGLVDLTFGNVSVADPARRVFAIKPSGVEYHRLTPADLVVLDFDGHVLEGTLRPSSDTPTHRCLFLHFAGIRAVVHTHSRHAVAFAQAAREIPCLGTTHCDHFHGPVPLTRALTAAEVADEYEWHTGVTIVERFQSLNPLAVPAVLVRNHGPFIWGPTHAQALESALALEIIADMAVKTLAINPTAAPTPPHLLDKHFFRKHGPGAYYGQIAR